MAQLDLGKDKWSMKIERFTPEQMKEILDRPENHEQQRTISANNVRKLVNEIKAGRYELNAQPIIFDRNGILIDGQHRLTAGYEAEQELEFFVIRGANPKMIRSIDSGRSRTPGDLMKIHNVTNAALVVGTSRLYLTWKTKFDLILKRKYIDKSIMNYHQDEIYEFYVKNKADVEFACSRYKIKSPIVNATGAQVLSFCFLVLHSKSKAKSYEFFENYESGVFPKEWLPMATVREQILTSSNGKEKLSANNRISLIFGMWNVMYHGVDLKSILEETLNIPKEYQP